MGQQLGLFDSARRQRTRPIAAGDGPVFDVDRSEAAKEAGMTAAAESRDKRELLKHARQLAVRIAQEQPDRCITADDVIAGLVAEGYSVHCLGNAAGSLFRGGNWESTGRWEKSARVHAHRNPLRVWRLKEGGN